MSIASSVTKVLKADPDLPELNFVVMTSVLEQN